jgi:hypothetical protein
MGYFCNFQNTTQSKQSPKGRKFAQSGHPVRDPELTVDLLFLKKSLPSKRSRICGLLDYYHTTIPSFMQLTYNPKRR